LSKFYKCNQSVAWVTWNGVEAPPSRKQAYSVGAIKLTCGILHEKNNEPKNSAKRFMGTRQGSHDMMQKRHSLLLFSSPRTAIICYHNAGSIQENNVKYLPGATLPVFIFHLSDSVRGLDPLAAMDSWWVQPRNSIAPQTLDTKIITRVARKHVRC